MQKFQYLVVVLSISIALSRAHAEELSISAIASMEQIAWNQWNKCILPTDGLKSQKLKVGAMASLGYPTLSNVEIC